MSINNSVARGLMLNLGTGYKFRVAKSLALVASVGYLYQGLKYDSPNVKGDYGGATIKVGLLL